MKIMTESEVLAIDPSKRANAPHVEALRATCLAAMAERDEAKMNCENWENSWGTVLEERDSAMEKAEAAEADSQFDHQAAKEMISDRYAAIARAEAAEAKVRQYELALSTTTDDDPTKTVSVASVPGSAFDVIIADRDYWKGVAHKVVLERVKLSCQLDVLRANIATLREALEWYADEETYRTIGRAFYSPTHIAMDAGKVARAALEKIK